LLNGMQDWCSSSDRLPARLPQRAFFR
jgi:hypothetical protein